MQGTAAVGLLPWSMQVAPAAAKPLSVSKLDLGDISVRVLSDGAVMLPAMSLAPNANPAQRTKAIFGSNPPAENVRVPINVTLIKTPKDLILVDVGSGTRFVETAGKLANAFDEISVDVGDVTKVVYTHAHPDLLWGTTDDFDELSFPNADYYISSAEWDFWMSDRVIGALPESQKAFGVGAQRNLNAVKDRISMVKAGDDIVTNVRVMETFGHTPGNISLEVGSGQSSAVILGDALTHPAISFAYPDWQTENDQDRTLAVKTRKRVLDQMSADQMSIVGYHLPNGGIGRVKKTSNGYAFEQAG